MDDKDKIQLMAGVKISMKNNEPLCVICNQTFAVTIWLRKHIMEEHMILCKPLFHL